MNEMGLTFLKAKMQAQKTVESEMRLQNSDIKENIAARRQPVGTVSALCSGSASNNHNFSTDRYSPSRSTIAIMNLGNYHWIPVAFEDSTRGKRTILEPNDPARTILDDMLINNNK